MSLIQSSNSNVEAKETVTLMAGYALASVIILLDVDLLI